MLAEVTARAADDVVGDHRLDVEVLPSRGTGELGRTELLEDVLEVRLDRVGRDVQPLRDVAVRVPERRFIVSSCACVRL